MFFRVKNYIGLKVLTRCVIFVSMRKKSVWEKLKIKFNGPKQSSEWFRRQFVDMNRLGGNWIVMKMSS